MAARGPRRGWRSGHHGTVRRGAHLRRGPPCRKSSRPVTNGIGKAPGLRAVRV